MTSPPKHRALRLAAASSARTAARLLLSHREVEPPVATDELTPTPFLLPDTAEGASVECSRRDRFWSMRAEL